MRQGLSSDYVAVLSWSGINKVETELSPIKSPSAAAADVSVCTVITTHTIAATRVASIMTIRSS